MAQFQTEYFQNLVTFQNLKDNDLCKFNFVSSLCKMIFLILRILLAAMHNFPKILNLLKYESKN